MAHLGLFSIEDRNPARGLKSFFGNLVVVSFSTAKSILVPIMVFVPLVIVFHAAVISVPIACEILLSVMVGLYPASTLVWWTSPVAFMPFVVSSNRVPVPLQPHISRAGATSMDANYAGARRGTNPDSERDLSGRCCCSR
jgi:hypothetical protein